ncbi:MAG: tetratricopeptide repeat protein [Gammaproteobacteria bacterium]|nr:tetratricopeptide repeat protein [Gammaproteobacteria bacterium]
MTPRIVRTMLIAAVTTMQGGCTNTLVDTLAVMPEINPVEHQPTEQQLQRNNAIRNYSTYLELSPDKAFANNALRRLADLELESGESLNTQDNSSDINAGKNILRSAINHYSTYLSLYPDNKDNDLVMYQLSKAYSLVGEQEKSLEVMDKVVAEYPESPFIDEIQFRRGEILFSYAEYGTAELAYQYIVSNKPASTLFEKASYKLGWSQFKQSKYPLSLETFFGLLDAKREANIITDSSINPTATDAEKSFASDVLRIVSITLSYNTDTTQLDEVFVNRPDRTYKPLIYKAIGELYLGTGRHMDAANVYIAYTKATPNSALAPEFFDLAIQAYKQGNFKEETLNAMKSYVQQFGVKTAFYLAQTPDNQQAITIKLKSHTLELAKYYHSIARTTRKNESFLQAAYWYGLYVESFPADIDTPHINFLLADAYYDGQDFMRAVHEYEKTAYSYPDHPDAADAGYAALISYDKLLLPLPVQPTDPQVEATRIATLKTSKLNSAVQFCNKFPTHKHILPVLTKTSEELFTTKNYALAIELATRVTDNKENTDSDLTRAAWVVRANSHYELKDFTSAELAYSEALTFTKKNSRQYAELSEGLAASIYKQGEQERENNQFDIAAALFLRVGTMVPQSTIRATAEYDAATMYIKMGNWNQAVPILENFRKNFPNHPEYGRSISEKLAYSYTESGQFQKAANEISLLIVSETDVNKKQQLNWQAAEMFEKSGDRNKANEMYIAYINNYPHPFERYIEAHFIVSEYFRETKQYELWGKWLTKTVADEKIGGENRSERTHYIAASALIHITKPVIREYEQSSLTMPIDKSLARKTALLEKALNAYKEIMSYQIAEFTTESTYRVGELYNQLGKSIMTSQRPGDLSEEELEQYDILLEEQAFPFEEKAIEIHTSNADRTKDGLYDQWIKKSIDLLAVLQPVRYQKTEKTQIYALPEAL